MRSYCFKLCRDVQFYFHLLYACKGVHLFHVACAITIFDGSSRHILKNHRSRVLYWLGNNSKWIEHSEKNCTTKKVIYEYRWRCMMKMYWRWWILVHLVLFLIDSSIGGYLRDNSHRKFQYPFDDSRTVGVTQTMSNFPPEGFKSKTPSQVPARNASDQ